MGLSSSLYEASVSAEDSFVGAQKGQSAGQLWRMMATLLSAVLIAAEYPYSAIIQP
jgi:hypothetical protein